jgi:hypothetical protein
MQLLCARKRERDTIYLFPDVAENRYPPSSMLATESYGKEAIASSVQKHAFVRCESESDRSWPRLATGSALRGHAGEHLDEEGFN